MQLYDIFISQINYLNWVFFGLMIGTIIPFIYFKPTLAQILTSALTGILGSFTGGIAAIFAFKQSREIISFNLTLLLFAVFASIILLTVLRIIMWEYQEKQKAVKSKTKLIRKKIAV